MSDNPDNLPAIVEGSLQAPSKPDPCDEPGYQGLLNYLGEPKAETDSGLWCYLRANSTREWVADVWLSSDDDDAQAHLDRIVEYAEQHADETGWIASLEMLKDTGYRAQEIAEALALAGWLPQRRDKGTIKRTGWAKPNAVIDVSAEGE